MSEKEKAIEKMASNLLQSVCSLVGCDIPRNADEIVTFMVNDVLETADPENWHSGDVGIAFRRWMECHIDSNIF
jgi:hypothetical protein